MKMLISNSLLATKQRLSRNSRFIVNQNRCGPLVRGGSIFLFSFVIHPLYLQPVIKGLSGDTNHVADADCLESSGVGAFISRSTADTENGRNVIHGVCPALGCPFSLVLSLSNSILKQPPESSVIRLLIVRFPYQVSQRCRCFACAAFLRGHVYVLEIGSM